MLDPARFRRDLQLPRTSSSCGRASKIILDLRKRDVLPRRHHPRERAARSAAREGVPAFEKSFSLTDVYGADGRS